MAVIELIAGVLLTVLKIIGIILLVILLAIIFIISSVLFVPIRYKFKGSFDTIKKEVNGQAGISWFLHFISLKIAFSGKEVIYKGKILGIPLIDSRRKKAAKDSTDQAKDDIDSNASETKSVEDNTELVKTKEAALKSDIGNEITKEEACEGKQPEKTVFEEQKEDDFNSRKERKSVFDSIRRKFFTTKEKIISISDKIKNVNGTRERYIEFLSAEESKSAIREIKEQILKVLKSILPKKIKADVTYGFTNPETTGKIYAMIAVIFVAHMEKLNIEPVFEDVTQTFATGKLEFKGRIRIIVILVAAIKIYFNKRLKEFMAFVRE